MGGNYFRLIQFDRHTKFDCCVSYRYHVGVLVGICIGPKNLGVPRRLNWDRIVIVWHYVIVKFTTYTSAHETCSCWVKKLTIQAHLELESQTQFSTRGVRRRGLTGLKPPKCLHFRGLLLSCVESTNLLQSITSLQCRLIIFCAKKLVQQSFYCFVVMGKMLELDTFTEYKDRNALQKCYLFRFFPHGQNLLLLYLWTSQQKAFSFRGLHPLTPTRGSAPGPRWGLCPQTPVIGSRYRARHMLYAS